MLQSQDVRELDGSRNIHPAASPVHGPAKADEPLARYFGVGKNITVLPFVVPYLLPTKVKCSGLRSGR